jgi:MFS superfamily sulfate permease-like transporter
MLLIREVPLRSFDEFDPEIRRRDWYAAAALFFVALPLCLGIAAGAEIPAISGLISGIVGALVVAPLSGSALMVSGPAAAMLPLIAHGLERVGGLPGLLTATSLAGVFQLFFSALRWGEVGAWVPAPVVRGLLTAIGLIVVLKQLPHLLGHDTDAMGDESFFQFDGSNTFSAIGVAVGHIHPAALATALVTLGVLYATRDRRSLPGAVTAVTLGSAFALVSGALSPAFVLDPTHYVDLPEMGRGPFEFPRPDWGALLRIETWVLAFELAIVGSLESLLGLEATDRIDPYRRISDPDRELLAQGVGNIVAGLLGGLPVAGVVVRSAAAVSAGAATRFATVAHGGLLATALMILPDALEFIPLSALAALLFWVGGGHVHPRVWREAWQAGPTTFVPFAATVVGVLLSSLLPGVIFGIGVAAAMALRESAEHSGFTVTTSTDGTVTWTLDHTVSFQHKARVRRELLALPELGRVHIDGRRCRVLDADVRTLIADFRMEAERRRITYTLSFPPEEAEV